MPGRIVPHKRSAHQFACRALYRALLRQTLQLPNETSFREEIAGHVARRFRADAKLQTLVPVANGMRVGYEALDLLRKSTHGSQEASTKIESIIKGYREKIADEAQHNADLNSVRSRRKPRAEQKQDPPRPVAEKPRDILADPIPLSAIPYKPASGRRRIPHFVTTMGIPFLRYYKPQPERLTAVIRGKLRTDRRRRQVREDLDVLIKLGEDEDEWDGLLAVNTDIIREDPWTSWTADLRAVEREFTNKMAAAWHKNVELGKRMFEVYLKEKELGEAEELARHKVKRIEKNRRRQLRKAEEKKSARIAERETKREGTQQATLRDGEV